MSVTLNIGSNTIRLLVTDGRKVKQWAEMPLEEDLVKDGLILQPADVAAALRQLFTETKAPRDRITVCLSGLNFTYRILDLPAMRPSMLPEAIDRGLRREIPLSLEELYLSWQKVASQRDHDDYFVLGISQNPFDLLLDTLTEAGLKPAAVDLRPLALARLSAEPNCLIVSMENDYYDIVILKDGIPTTMHTLTPRGEQASLEDNVQRLAEEISRTVKFHNTSHPDAPVDENTRFYLTGEAATEPQVVEIISRETGYSAEALECPFQAPPDFPANIYSYNIGLAIRTESPDKKTPAAIINMNLLDGKRRAEARAAGEGLKLKSILLPLALGAAAIGLGFIIISYNQAIDSNNRQMVEFSSLSLILSNAREIASTTGALEAQIAGTNAQIDAVQTAQQAIRGYKGNIVNALRDVTDALSAEVDPTEIEVNANEISVSGRASDELTVVSYARALEGKGFKETRIVSIETNDDTDYAVVFLISIQR